MPASVPPLSFFCIHALARFPDHLHHFHPRRVPASPALLDALPHSRDPCIWATLAQLVHPLPPHLHDLDLPLSHPDLPLLQKIPDSPDFTLVTLVSLPNYAHLRDDDIANLRTLHRLLALDLRGCSISSDALARGLAAPSSNDSTRTGTWGLRLLSLHGCPNIDDGALSVFHKFPLLSAVDLRFTRCTPTAVNARLSSLGFHPSGNNSLFHPAPLSLALCTLEKIAHTASIPISLYSCAPQSVFRVHINELNHLSPHPKKVVPVDGSSVSHTTIRTTFSAEDTVVFIPPLRKPAKNALFPPLKPSVSPATVPVVPTPPPVDRPTSLDPDSNVSSFYEIAPAQNRHSKTSILPLCAQAVQSVEGGKLDPLAIARPPPPWKIPDTYNSPVTPNPYVTVACHQGAFSDNVENSRRKRPIAHLAGRALDNPLRVDHARLHKRSSDTVADMVHQFAGRRLKVESEFALARTRAAVSAKSSCNPFARSARSVFAESNTKTFDELPASVHEFSKEADPDTRLRVCRSPPSETVRLAQGPEIKGTSKPLKPIMTLKPPILPKELLPTPPRYTSKPKRSLKQSRLSFSREDKEV